MIHRHLPNCLCKMLKIHNKIKKLLHFDMVRAIIQM